MHIIAFIRKPFAPLLSNVSRFAALKLDALKAGACLLNACRCRVWQIAHAYVKTGLGDVVGTCLLPTIHQAGSLTRPNCHLFDLFNVSGNKGGVGICFDLGLTSFLFIASHFHAHQV